MEPYGFPVVAASLVPSLDIARDVHRAANLQGDPKGSAWVRQLQHAERPNAAQPAYASSLPACLQVSGAKPVEHGIVFEAHLEVTGGGGGAWA